MFALLELPRINNKCCYCEVETTAQLRSGRPHKLIERDCRVLKHVVRKNNLSSVVPIIPEFQNASGRNVSTVRWELHEMGFHGRVAAHKPKINMRNAMRRLEWCKARTIGLCSSGNMFS